MVLLLAFATQSLAQGHHEHGPEERDHCIACAFGTVPGEPTIKVAEPLPPDAHQHAEALASARIPPRPPVEPLDVSFSTSPPRR